MGDPARPDTQMGPLINERRRDAVEMLVADAIQQGAELLAGGRRNGNSGYFFEPTVLGNVSEHARVMNEEPFGPLALLAPFDDAQDAIDSANRLPFGLAAYAFTRSAQNVHLASSRLEAGVVGINRFGISEPETPFGGIKDSGHGREGGIEGLESYCATKFVTHAQAI